MDGRQCIGQICSASSPLSKDGLLSLMQKRGTSSGTVPCDSSGDRSSLPCLVVSPSSSSIRSMRPISSSMLRTPSLAIHSRVSRAMNRK
jgi:hypothetical protein